MIQITDDIAWTKVPFDVVDSWEKFRYPQHFFPMDFANQVKEAHSLEATLFFAKVRAVQESKRRQLQRKDLLKNTVLAESGLGIVDTWDKYHHPNRYFPDYFAERVKNAHSSKADQYFEIIRNTSSQIGDDNMSWILYYKYQVQAMVSFAYRLVIYILLIALGFPLGGWFWPKSFRAFVLSLGMDDEHDEAKKDTHDDAS
jgi:hypothetical protein